MNVKGRGIMNYNNSFFCFWAFLVSCYLIVNLNFIDYTHTFCDSAFSASLHCTVGADPC